MLLREDQREKRSWGIGKLSASHWLLIAYAVLLVTFAVIAVAMWNGE